MATREHISTVCRYQCWYYISWYYICVNWTSLVWNFHSSYCAYQFWTVAYLLWLPHHPLSSLVFPVSNPAFRRGRTIFSASPSSMRMFSRSVPRISTDDRPPSPGSAIFGKCSVGWWLRPGERFQSSARPIRECQAEDRGTLGGSSHAYRRAGERTARNEKVEGRTTRRKRRRGEPSEGHASAQSLVRSQTNRRPAHVGLYVPTPPGRPFPTWGHVCTPPFLGALVTRVSAATSTLTRQTSQPLHCGARRVPTA